MNSRHCPFYIILVLSIYNVRLRLQCTLHMLDAHLPRLGPPVLDASGRVTFISDDRFVFDRHHAAFERTSATSRMLPPVYKDGRVHISTL
ncbi:MAG: hypothetical protein JZU63_02190 [Rhodoferax sp.]|nr:hypothetical protein [Rhodoferax sp.]